LNFSASGADVFTFVYLQLAHLPVQGFILPGLAAMAGNWIRKGKK